MSIRNLLAASLVLVRAHTAYAEAMQGMMEQMREHQDQMTKP